MSGLATVALCHLTVGSRSHRPEGLLALWLAILMFAISRNIEDNPILLWLLACFDITPYGEIVSVETATRFPRHAHRVAFDSTYRAYRYGVNCMHNIGAPPDAKKTMQRIERKRHVMLRRGARKKVIYEGDERRSVRFDKLCTLEWAELYAETTDFNRSAAGLCHHLTFIHLTLPTSPSEWLPKPSIKFWIDIQN